MLSFSPRRFFSAAALVFTRRFAAFSAFATFAGFAGFTTFVVMGLAFAAAAAPARAAVAPSHVQASLVAADASVQPGRAFTVALRLVHDAHWHTYWKNPGTGLATALKWKLPPGWTASEILWPAPHVIADKAGNITGTGYEGDLLLPVTLTPPADLRPGDTVALAAKADWLMCADICVPGFADVALTLPVAAAAPAPDAAWGEKIRATLAALPRAAAAWQVTATRAGKTLTLAVTPAAASAAPTSSAVAPTASPTSVTPAANPTLAPKDLHVFTDDSLVAYDLPQKISADGRGGFTFVLPVGDDAPANAKNFLGVLTAESGWLAGGALRGLRVEVPLVIAAAAASAGTPAAASGRSAAPAPASLLATLALALLGGLVLNFMPCVFPVLGIKILGFVKEAGHDRRKVVAHGLVFALGVLLSFWTLAAVLAVLRASGQQVGWGFQLQDPRFVLTLAAVMLVFALNMSGVFEFGLAATAVGGELQSKSGFAGSFFTGVLATVVATPCSAPFLAPALGVALAVPVAESFVIFTAIAVGLSAPYLLLSIFPAAVKLLPRPGAWMETFKQFMAFPLYATVGWLAWVLTAQVEQEEMLNALLGLTLIALAVWIYGRWHAPGATTGRARFGHAGLVVVGASGLWLAWPRVADAHAAATAATAASASASSASATATTDAAPPVVWEKWSPETVAKLRAEGRPVYVDFTALWCATCQTNKRLVFRNDAVRKIFAAKKIATLRADWTKKDPQITAELAAYQRSAVPFNVIWLPGQTDPVILPEVLTPGTVLEALGKK
ncbi:MAG: hypothetical protein RLZZ15_3875 [Verrucomicrobiota bacterium]